VATLAHAEPWLPVISWALGHQDRSLVAERRGEVCGVLPMMLLKHWLFGTFHVSLPWLDYGGVLADNPETAQELLDAATAQARLPASSAGLGVCPRFTASFNDASIGKSGLTYRTHVRRSGTSSA